MIALLLALQVTTHCVPDYAGGVNCTTIQPPIYQPPYDYYGQFQRNIQPQPDYRAIREQEIARQVGKMIAAGDCQGAVNYALQQGALAIAEQAKAACNR